MSNEISGRGKFALILGIIVVVAALGLRIVWRYTTPSARDTVAVLDIFQNALVEGLAPDDTTETYTGTNTTDVDLPKAVTITPNDAAAVDLIATDRDDLVTGLLPHITANSSTEGFNLGFLTADRYTVKPYDASLQPLTEGETTLVDQLQLVYGLLPETVLTKSADSYFFVYPVVTETGTVQLMLKRFADFSASASVQALQLTSLSDATSWQAAVTAQGSVAVLLTFSNDAPHLLTFTPEGVLQVEQILTQFDQAITLVGDTDTWVVFGQTESGLRLEKISSLGVTTQAVEVELPTDLFTSTSQLQRVTRSGRYVAVLLSDRVLLFSDDMQQLLGQIMLTPLQLYVDTLIQDENLYLVYNTPVSLTEYTIHVDTYELPAPL